MRGATHFGACDTLNGIICDRPRRNKIAVAMGATLTSSLHYYMLSVLLSEVRLETLAPCRMGWRPAKLAFGFVI